MSASSARRKALSALADRWLEAWPEALAAWSRYTRLRPPRFCLSPTAAREEGLPEEGFAMIRLADHAVVIGLGEVSRRGLDSFALPILAHEVGHHVYAPANLRDNARLLARVRAGLGERAGYAPMVANLYADLLINDRLKRRAGVAMDAVYVALCAGKPAGGEPQDRLWQLYLRIYELLWSLPGGTLASTERPPSMRADGPLGAKLVRVYARDWLEGAGRFACLCLPYLLLQPEDSAKRRIPPWLDTLGAGGGDALPDGLAEAEGAEEAGAIHPVEDPRISGLPDEDDEGEEGEGGAGGGSGAQTGAGGKKSIKTRSPEAYRELMRSVGVTLSPAEVVARYYRELALPHLVPFPMRRHARAGDPLPEGLEPWEIGSPLQRIDWLQSLLRSPQVIPGVTTVERVYGRTPGGEPRTEPLDLYLGVDCSGSMGNPAVRLSYPVLAGAVMALSALRGGARVMVTLSGEPGKHSSTDGFRRDQKEVLGVLTSYLGTGYAFGIRRLKETFIDGEAPERPVHLMVLTDSDIFKMLQETKGGWTIAAEALQRAGGGGTLVLEIPRPEPHQEQLDRLEQQGWAIHLVRTQKEMVRFARAFARETYGEAERDLNRGIAE